MFSPARSSESAESKGVDIEGAETYCRGTRNGKNDNSEWQRGERTKGDEKKESNSRTCGRQKRLFIYKGRQSDICAKE